MAKKTYLFKKSVNEILKLIAEWQKPQAFLPSDMELSRSLGISRTTLRACIDYLCEKAIVRRGEAGKEILRCPKKSDYFTIDKDNHTKNSQFEKYFLNLIHAGKLTPGDRFSELSLAKDSGCTTITVREFLIKFSNNGLIEKIPRGRWKMASFDQAFARELISFREIIEIKAIMDLVKLPKENPVWDELEFILAETKAIGADLDNRYQEFPDLDRAFHLAVQKCTNNRFIDQFFDITSFICHYHYQWDKTGEKLRFAEAIEEHIDILNHLLVQDIPGSILTMKKHLKTAELTLLRCVHGLEE